jgi:hypothetical protein
MDRDHCGREEEHRVGATDLGRRRIGGVASVGFFCFRRESAFDAAAGLWDGGCPFISMDVTYAAAHLLLFFFSFGFSFLFSLVTSSLSFSVDPLHFCTHDMLQGLRLSCWPPWLAQVVQHCKPNWVGHRTPSHWPPHALCFGSRANCS